jgi:tetratricopeptide (TPR) repeat protein
LFEGLGSYTRAIFTDSPDAQRYFNQGLAFLHGFNHGAAIRSFQQAAEQDPDCAMVHWAIALASGPHINSPSVPPPAAELAWKELNLAKQHAAGASPVEVALIEALGHRYANPQPADRTPLDHTYAEAMRQVWQKFPDDPDVGAFFAEAMMNLRPWDQWTLEGQAQPGTDEIVATLDAVLKLNIDHPFANHLYIHAIEASPYPERANAAGDRLRVLQPGLAHNVHMSSHIDIRCGRWQQAIDTNARAIEADQRYRTVAGNAPKGFLPVYVAHNRHMLAFGAMMTGQSELAIEQIRALVAELPEDFLQENALTAESFAAMPLEVLVRFGRWDEILAEPDSYPEYMPFTRAFHSAARAIAFTAQGDLVAARKEQASFLERLKRVPKEASVGNNSAAAVLAIVTSMVEGEILIGEGELEEGLSTLRSVITKEDALRYDEPPGWLIPIRHSLGANLLGAKRYAEAEQVYREDLKRLPQNGWSLFGLARSLKEQGKAGAAGPIEALYREVWSKADVQITSSCLCVPGV